MKRIGQCYLCGASAPDTRDHVIPDCFFTDPRPKNLLTFPAHRACNEKYTISDEYTRDILASLGMDSSATARKLWDGKVDRSIKGNRALSAHIAASLLPKIDKFSAGGIYLGSAPGIRIDRARFYPTTEKIARGLHRLCAGSPMPCDAKFRWLIQEPLQGIRRQCFEASRASMSYADVFDSRYLVMPEEDGSIARAVWWFRFYRATTLECAVTFSPVRQPTPKQSRPTNGLP